MRDRPLHDIRYFESTEDLSAGGAFPVYAGTLFELPRAATAFGQRVGRLAELKGVSIGRATHLYLCFSTALPEGALRVTRAGLASWHLIVMAGLPARFNGLPVDAREALVSSLTFRALSELAVTGADQLPGLQRQIEAGGEALRLPVKSKTWRGFNIAIEQTIPCHPAPSEVFATVRRLDGGQTATVKLGEVAFYDEVPTMVDRLSVKGHTLQIHPRKSFRAGLVTSQHGLLPDVDLGALFPANLH